MAEAIANACLSGKIRAYSAGVSPGQIHPLAIETLGKMGIDVGHANSKHVDLFKNKDMDLVVTVCDNARDSCPCWPNDKTRIIHFPIDDPAKIRGSKQEVLAVFEEVANIIERELLPVVKRELDLEG